MANHDDVVLSYHDDNVLKRESMSAHTLTQIQRTKGREGRQAGGDGVVEGWEGYKEAQEFNDSTITSKSILR